MSFIKNIFSSFCLGQSAESERDPYKDYVKELLPIFKQCQVLREENLRPKITLFCGVDEIGAFRGTEAPETISTELEQIVRKCLDPDRLGYMYNNPRDPSDRGDFSEGK